MTSILVRKRKSNSGDKKGAGNLIKKLPTPFFLSGTVPSFVYSSKPSFFNQFAKSLSALATASRL